MTQRTPLIPVSGTHTESDGERPGSGQIKAGHVGEPPLIELTSLSAPVFIIIQQDPLSKSEHENSQSQTNMWNAAVYMHFMGR